MHPSSIASAIFFSLLFLDITFASGAEETCSWAGAGGGSSGDKQANPGDGSGEGGGHTPSCTSGGTQVNPALPKLGEKEIYGDDDVAGEELMHELVAWMSVNGAEGLLSGEGVGDEEGEGTVVEIDIQRSPENVTIDRSLPKSRPNIGLRAAKDIPGGGAIVFVPRKLHIVVDDVLLAEEEAPYDLKDGASSWSSYTFLAAFLLQEVAKGKASFWFPFLRSLPRYVSLPIFFDPSVLAAVDYPPFSSQVEEHKEAYELEFEKCKKAGKLNATRSEFFWAMSVVSSRCFSLSSGNVISEEDLMNSTAASINEPESRFNMPVMMVPFVDMMDHSAFHNNDWEITKSSFLFRAELDIPANSTLLTNYGAKPTDEFLLSYGFVPEYNQHDHVPLFFNMDEILAFFGNTVTPNGEFFVEAEEWAVRVADEIETRVEEVAPSGEESVIRLSLQYSFDGATYYVWPKGLVEPRLIAIFAALWHRWTYKEDPDFSKLAHAAVTFGLDTEETNCTHMKSTLSDSLAASIEEATSFIRMRAKERIANFTTTYFEDEAQLKAIVKCRGGNPNAIPVLDYSTSAPDDAEELDLSVCTEEVMDHAHEWELILQFKLVKKSILHEAHERLAWACDPKLENFRQAIVGDAEFIDPSEDM